jgi:predicted transcriptional regulator
MVAATFNEKIWFAIAEPSRRNLIDILIFQGEASSSKLAKEVSFSRQAVTKHIAVLKKVGLIRERRAGKEIQFSIEPSGLAVAIHELSTAAELWDARLQKIKQIAEAIHQDSR